MFAHSVTHSPGNHAGEMPERDRVALRAELLRAPLARDIMSCIIQLNEELKGSYPERLAMYERRHAGLPIFSRLRRLADELICGEGPPSEPDGYVFGDDIAEILQCSDSQVERMLEMMHQADLLMRRQEVVIPPPTVNGTIGYYFVPDAVSYKVSEIGERALADLSNGTNNA